MTRLRSIQAETNKLAPEDRAGHDWYRFVLSFPPHLVRDYLEEFEVTAQSQVLDPFCGTGTTLVECAKRGIKSVGVEANPMAHFAAEVKTNWSGDPSELLHDSQCVADEAAAAMGGPPWRTLPEEAAELLLADSISPLPLHRTLVLLETLNRNSMLPVRRYQRLALAKALVTTIGNLRFGPEVGVGPPKADSPVLESWLENVRAIACDLEELRRLNSPRPRVHHADSRRASALIEPKSIDAIVTSPPYPNEKDYTRTTRLESVLLGFLKNKADLRALKGGLMRSNTRNVYKDDHDDEWIAGHGAIQQIADAIENRRIELGKTSGFERLYARVTRLYFGGMARHLEELKPLLKPGARLAYVVGDQASYLRIMIRTGQLLADVAQRLGYRVDGIDLFRTRRATATGELLREEVLLLRWPG
ncbi:MAG: DNA methyltransferase [Tepidisphaeraceae bacterium]